MTVRTMKCFGLLCLLFGVGSLFVTPGVVMGSGDFQQKYIQGKLLLKQKLYADAIRGLEPLRQTSQGQHHFGLHYYLGIAHYYRGDIRQALDYLHTAWSLATKPRHRKSIKRARGRIAALFGRFQVTRHLASGSIHRLRLQLRTTEIFRHPHRVRVYQMVQKRWSTQGMLLDGKPIYLPKGTYSLHISKPQCFSMGLTKNGVIQTQMELRSQLSLALQAKASCPCTRGRVLRIVQQKHVCACPSGRMWSRSKQACLALETRSRITPPVLKPKPVKGPSPWVWVSLASVAVLTGGALAIHFLVLEPQNRKEPATISGRLWKGPQ